MAKPKQTKVPVSRRALIQRIRRELRKHGRDFRAARGAFVVIENSAVVETHADLATAGRETGALRVWEELED